MSVVLVVVDKVVEVDEAVGAEDDVDAAVTAGFPAPHAVAPSVTAARRSAVRLRRARRRAEDAIRRT